MDTVWNTKAIWPSNKYMVFLIPVLPSSDLVVLLPSQETGLLARAYNYLCDWLKLCTMKLLHIGDIRLSLKTDCMQLLHKLG